MASSTADTGADHTQCTAVPPRGGGVGAGLATRAWWNQYYAQSHFDHFDWYLPNEVVLETILDEAKNQCGLTRQPNSDDSDDDDDDETATDPEADTAAAILQPPTQSRYSLATLPTLQLGCGSSEITALLWTAGLRTMRNIDFSSECIAKMRALQIERGWVHTDDATATGASTFTFDVMDVRELTYPDESFALVFDKGTIECVCLESAEGATDGHAMIAEVYRVLKPGGVCIIFSLYPPAVRARLWISCIGADRSPEAAAERADLLEVMETTDNPPSYISTPEWSQLRMIALDQSPLELPDQKHTYLYISVKR